MSFVFDMVCGIFAPFVSVYNFEYLWMQMKCQQYSADFDCTKRNCSTV